MSLVEVVARRPITFCVAAIAVAGLLIWWLVPADLQIAVVKTPPAPPALTFSTPYRIFRIGGERVGPWTVCGEWPQLGQGTWGSEGQVCVFVMKGNTARAVACGTQMFVVDTGQPCGQ